MRPLFALFMRSVREDSRARLPIILRTALVLIILLIFFASRRSMGYSTAPGRDLFFAIMLLNCAFIALTALSIFPAAIAEEKEDETLTMLRMTNLSALAILFGKSTSRLFLALFLLAVQVPFTLLCVTLGGVSQTQVWSAYAVLGATTFFLCNLSLLTSVYCKTTIRAGFLTAFFGGIFYCAIPALYMMTFSRRMMRMAGPGPGTMSMPGVNPTDLWEQIGVWFLQANPVWALGNLLQVRGVGLITEQIWFSVGGGVACFLLSWLIFDRYCSKTGDEVIRPAVKTRSGKVRRLARVPRPGIRWPLAWKDFHFMIGGRFGLYLRLLIAVLGYGAVYGLMQLEYADKATRYGYTAAELMNMDLTRRMWDDISEATMGGAMCLAGLELLLVTGRIFGVERRRLTLSSLVGLPWKTGRVIRQKILGCIPVLLPWFALAAVGFALHPGSIFEDLRDELSRITWRKNREFLCTALYVVLQALLFLTTIVWFSLRLRRGALPAAIVIIGVWNFLFGMVVDEFRGNHQFLAILVGVWLTLPVLILMGRGVYYRLQLVAAED